MVSVPVLSVQSTSIAPKFWIEFSRLTITFFRDMASAPFERHTDTIIGSISGVRQHLEVMRRQPRFRPIALRQGVDDKHQRRHHDDEPDHQPREAGDTSVK